MVIADLQLGIKMIELKESNKYRNYYLPRVVGFLDVFPEKKVTVFE